MSAATGLRMKGFYATDYAGVIEAMRFNKIQIAWYGNKSGMEAVDRAGGEVLAQVVSRDGRTGYYSHLIVHASSPYKSVDDILKCDKSIDFSIGDPNSTSGYLVPTAYIFAPRNIDPKSCFKTLRNASHQANAMAVANRQVAAATNNSEDLERMETTAPEARRNIRVIWTSPVIPLDPIVWRKDLDPAVKTKLYTFILGYGRLGTPEEIAAARAVLANLLWSPFTPSSNAQLLPTRKLEANRNLTRVQGDDRLSAAEKAKQTAAIEAELAGIETAGKAAADDGFRNEVAAFLAADKAGDKETVRNMIAQFAASLAHTQ
jgi:phosphonate transport system substrate-binding protein